MQITVNLKAGKAVPVAISGTYFLLMETGTAASLALEFMDGARQLESLQTAKRGTKARPAAGRFTQVNITAAVDTTAQVVISDGAVDIDVFDGASVAATIEGLPLPVSLDRGTPANPLNVTAFSVADSPAQSITDAAPVAVTSAALATLATASATRRGLRLYNQGPDPVAIGGGALTWARRAIVLEAGDTWEETKGANLEWRAICDAGKTATVGVQGVSA
jgi:hypothetical protein